MSTYSFDYSGYSISVPKKWQNIKDYVDIWIKWCLVNIKQGLDLAVMCKNNNQAVGALCRPLLLCVIYISSIVYYAICILTVLFNKSIWFIAFNTLFELITIASLLLYMYFKNCCSLTSIFITTKNNYYNYRALWNPFYFQIHFYLSILHFNG